MNMQQMQQMMKQAQQMQERLQQQMTELRVEASAGGGMVISPATDFTDGELRAFEHLLASLQRIGVVSQPAP